MPSARAAITAIAVAFALAPRPVFGRCAPVEFAGGYSTYAGRQPRTLTLANINNDGWIDAVVGSWDYNYEPVGGIYVLLGASGGRWRPHAQLVPEQNVFDIVAGDFDGDGDDDLAFTEHSRGGSGDAVNILTNDAGSLHVTSTIAREASVGGLATGDFNGDGRSDLATFWDEEGRVLLGSARGLAEEKAFATVPDRGRPTAADVNGDGLDDLVVGEYSDASSGSNIHLFLGDRDAVLLSLKTVPSQLRTWEVDIGDFDGDGSADVAAYSGLGSGVEVIPNAGSDAAASPRLSVLDVFVVENAAVADFDGDGIDDLAAFSWIGLQLLKGTADGVFALGDLYYASGRGWQALGPADVAAADIDGDGDADVAVVSEDGLTVLVNDGRGNLLAPRFGTFGHAVGDFNGDGRDDVLDDHDVRLAAVDGAIARASISQLFDNREVRFARTADLNRDEHLDAIWFLDESPSSRHGRVRIALGRGDGTLGAPTDFEIGGDYQDGLLADIDADGVLDIVVVNYAHAEPMSIAYGRGDGTFGDVRDIEGSPFTSEIDSGDFNGDGRTDIAVATANEPLTLQIALNDGRDGFAAPVGAVWGGDVFRAADFNGDGLSDLVTATAAWHWGPGELRVHLNRGDGTFTAARSVGVSLSDLNDMHVRDFDGDGKLDVLLTEGGTTASEGWMELFVGDGKGRLGPALRQRSVAWGTALAGDFNGDGKMDVLDGGFARMNLCAEAGSRRRSVR